MVCKVTLGQIYDSGSDNRVYIKHEITKLEKRNIKVEILIIFVDIHDNLFCPRVEG